MGTWSKSKHEDRVDRVGPEDQFACWNTFVSGMNSSLTGRCRAFFFPYVQFSNTENMGTGFRGLSILLFFSRLRLHYGRYHLDRWPWVFFIRFFYFLAIMARFGMRAYGRSLGVEIPSLALWIIPAWFVV